MIVPYSDEWQRKANALARSFCPKIYPCQKCNEPVVYGYCCEACGDTDPTSGPKGRINE